MSLLDGKRVLIVEDEPLVALLLEEMLLDLGCEVAGPAYSLDDGIRLASTETLDAAVLDVNLNGVMSDRVADTLRERNVPFAYATGYGASLEGSGVPVLHKPYPLDRLEAVLQQLVASSGS